MVLHLMIVDDEEDVLEALVPGFVNDLVRGLERSREFQAANEAAGSPLRASERINIRVSAAGYRSVRAASHVARRPVHVHLHLCCDKGGSFRNALRLLREQFYAVVVSDLRFSDDAMGSRAGRLLIEDVWRRNPETTGILYSAYQCPEGFPADRFVRKGASASAGAPALVARMVEGATAFLRHPDMLRVARELARRGLVYQSDDFGSTLRRIYDYATLHFGREPAPEPGRRRPRPLLLLDGETGTGKTELAGLFHALSERRDHPFVPATCNQLSDETFLRSALFGHVKGAFSGALADRSGLVESAGAGVLLLDDLHKLGDGSSLILHSFLDDGTYSRLGQDEVRRTSAVSIVATVESPRWERIKAEQRLSESFIHRVEQFVLRIPPLRARPEDIECQAQHYCQEQGQRLGEEMELSQSAIEWLAAHGFPGGNSRKLRDFLKGVITAHARVTDYIDVAELEEYARETGLEGAPSALHPGAVPRPVPQAAVPQGPTAQEEISPPAATAAAGWGVLAGESGWKPRIAQLAVRALAEDLGIDPSRAEAICKTLFEEDIPRLWQDFLALGQGKDLPAPIEIKLFDELFRYYAVYRAGSPAKAAKELGMNDNALREFIYSREQKRGSPGGAGP